MQAAFHGVPILGLPHFGDQEMNALKAVGKVAARPPCTLPIYWVHVLACKGSPASILVCSSCCRPAQGTGLHLFREQVTPGAVHAAVMRLLSEGSFREAAQRVSRRLRSRKRTPLQEAAGGSWLCSHTCTT